MDSRESQVCWREAWSWEKGEDSLASFPATRHHTGLTELVTQYFYLPE